MTYGHFSTIHPGHIRYLKNARNRGNKLYLALIGDENSNKIIFSQSERAQCFRAATGFETSAQNIKVSFRCASPQIHLFIL